MNVIAWLELKLVLYTLISITTVIHIQADSDVSVTNGFINFWLRSMATRGETHNSYKSMLTILCWPHPNARRILWGLRSQFISASRDPKNSTTSLNGRIPNWRLFKILKFSGPSLLGMTSSILRSHFLFEVYYDKWWLSYPMRAGVRLHPMTQTEW